MNIKKIIRTLPVFILMAITIQANASTIAISREHSVTYTINNDSLRMVQINRRLAEIQTMNLSDLSSPEKKDLKKELIAMKKEATMMEEEHHHSGIYISVGAVIIIILLLILLR